MGLAPERWVEMRLLSQALLANCVPGYRRPRKLIVIPAMILILTDW